jgi:uncharacterized phage-associated protein
MIFTASKVAQMAAVFARKEGGAINVLKLAKLLYLADRESMNRYSAPISFDKFVALKDGPMLSKARDLVQGKIVSEAWSYWMSPRKGLNVALAHEFTRDDLDQLSDADLEILDSVWDELGAMDRFELRDYVHEHCPEWKNPGDTSKPINEAEIFRALGLPAAEAKNMAESVRIERRLDRIFGR